MTLSRSVVSFLMVALAGIASCSQSNQGKNAGTTGSEQAVLIHFDPANAPGGKLTPLGLADLEDKLIAVIVNLKLGEFDGNEFAVDGTSATFYMYGPDAERLFAGIEPTLRSRAVAMLVLKYEAVVLGPLSEKFEFEERSNTGMEPTAQKTRRGSCPDR